MKCIVHYQIDKIFFKINKIHFTERENQKWNNYIILKAFIMVLLIIYKNQSVIRKSTKQKLNTYYAMLIFGYTTMG